MRPSKAQFRAQLLDGLREHGYALALEIIADWATRECVSPEMNAELAADLLLLADARPCTVQRREKALAACRAVVRDWGGNLSHAAQLCADALKP